MTLLKPFVKTFVSTLLVILLTSFFLLFKSNAGTLGDVYMYFTRIKAGLDGSGSNAVQLVLAFTTSQSIPSGSTVKIQFPDYGDTTWCRANGSLTATGVTSSTVDLSGTDWDIDSALPGSLSATCAQGSGTSSADTITISNVTALTSGPTYGVQLTSSTGRIGTYTTAGQHDITITVQNGATIDSMTFEIQLVSNDQVVVSATVTEAPSVTCSISTNTVNLGTLYPGGNYAIGSHTITTTGTNGYYWAAYGTGNGSSGDAGLYKSTSSTYLIPSGATSTLDLRVANSEGFGLTLSDPDTSGPAQVATNFVDTTLGVFGTLDRGSQGAKLILSKGLGTSGTETSTVTYGARAGTSAIPGAYQETVTYVCGGYFSAPLEPDDDPPPIGR